MNLKNKSFILLLFLCTALGTHAQLPTYEWARKIGGINEENITAVTEDNAGNVYITGQFKGTIDFDPSATVVNLTSVGTNYNAFFAKYTSTGNLIWAKHIQNSTGHVTGKDLKVDASGNVYLTGFVVDGITDFDPSAAVANLTSNYFDGFVAKYDQNGNYSWAFLLSGGSDEQGQFIDLDADGNVYVSGYLNGYPVDFDPSPATAILTPEPQDIFLAKYDPSGNHIWSFCMGTPYGDYLGDMAIAQNGDILLFGQVPLPANFNPLGTPTTITSTGPYMDAFIARYNSSGILQMVINIEGTNSVNGWYQTLTVDANNRIYVAGEFKGTADFDPSPAVFNLTATSTFGTQSDTYIASYSFDGDFLWASKLTGNMVFSPTGLKGDAAGNLFLGGAFTGTVDFDPGSGTAALTSSGGYDGYLARYDHNGNYISAFNIWNNSSEMTGIHDVYVNNGKLYLTGIFNGSVDLDPSPAIASLSAASGGDDFFAKYTYPYCTPSTSELTITTCNSYTVPSGHETYSLSGTYMDTIPNTAGCDSIITIHLTIEDLIAPGANAANLTDITAQCSVISLTAPTATDNCAGTITGTHNATLPITTQGTTIVTWTYDDGNGNTSTQTQNVVITDNTAPVANIASLTNVTAQCSVTSLTSPAATDNCVGTITGTHNVTLPITTQGTTVVTWTYDDGNGNTSTQTQNVVITDDTAPVANIASLADVTNQCSVTSLTAPTATDNCAGTITGTTPTTFPITTQGTTVVTWTYNDGNGNTSSQTQNVIVTVPVATTTLSGLTITATTSGATYQWINCGNGNTPISGATSQSYTATANGTYAVIVTQNGCSATSACVTISTVGLDEVSQTQFTIYPNPNNGMFTIETGLQTTITITNAEGKLISTIELQEGQTKIDLDAVESGIYFIHSLDVNGQKSVRKMSLIK